MRSARENLHWQTLWWWLAALAVVLLLKQHYSVAAAADLEWMLRPLSRVLEWISGHDFHRGGNHEWVSESADVRLVKACAGINFMLMSLTGYAWTARPGRHVAMHPVLWIAGRAVLLGAIIVAAWATSLLANSLRIIAAMTLDSDAWGLDVMGIDAAGLHRLIGMVIYVPLLSLQMALGGRGNAGAVLAGPVLMYLSLMVVVPLLTRNALQHPALFAQHLLHVSIMIAVMCGIYVLLRNRPAAAATPRLRAPASCAPSNVQFVR